MEYVGGWSSRRAAWCALSEAGEVVRERAVAADVDGAAGHQARRRCARRRGLMSGAIWVRDTLAAAGCKVQVAHAREVRDVAPLACKTDTVAGHGTAAAHSVVTRSG